MKTSQPRLVYAPELRARCSPLCGPHITCELELEPARSRSNEPPRQIEDGVHKLLRAAATCACLELACTHADTAQTTHNQVSAIYEPQASVHRKKEKANARTGQANSASSEESARLRCTPECIVCVVARVRGERCMGTLARRTPPNWDGVLDSALGKSFITRPFLGRRRRVDVVVESLVLRGAFIIASKVRRALVLGVGTNIAVLLGCSKSSRQCNLSYFLLTLSKLHTAVNYTKVKE